MPARLEHSLPDFSDRTGDVLIENVVTQPLQQKDGRSGRQGKDLLRAAVVQESAVALSLQNEMSGRAAR